MITIYASIGLSVSEDHIARSALKSIRAFIGFGSDHILPERQSLEEGLASVAQRMAERIQAVPADRRNKLLTDAYLLTGLRVRRDVATRIFGGVRAMHESDTFLAILDEGQEKARREDILVVGEERLGLPDESIKQQLNNITDLDRLRRMHRRAVKAANWREILDTP